MAECNAYEKHIKDYGGIELFLGGIGKDGHFAFNVISSISSISPHDQEELNLLSLLGARFCTTIRSLYTR